MKRFNLVICLTLFLFAVGANAQTNYFTNYTTTDGLPDNYVSGGVAVDHQNNKWFGTSNGVARLSSTGTWTTFTTSDGIAGDYINSIGVDKDGNVWVGTDNGVCKYDGSTWTTFTTTDGLIDNSVIGIHSAPDGAVWFATYSGASRLNNSVWTNFNSSDGLPTDAVLCIATDSVGNTWFGTMMGGVAVYNGTTFTIIDTTSSDLPDNNVFSIAVDANNNKWVGTWYGLSKFDNNNSFEVNYTYLTGLHNDFIRDLTFDPSGNLWVGMFADYNLDGGISFYNGSNWYSWTTTDGLVNSQVIKMACDDEYLWIATGNGVSRMSLSADVNENSLEKMNCMVYPNPVSTDLFVSSDVFPVQVSLFDILGNEILNTNLETNSSLDLSNLSAGIYSVRIQGENATVTSKIVVKK